MSKETLITILVCTAFSFFEKGHTEILVEVGDQAVSPECAKFAEREGYLDEPLPEVEPEVEPEIEPEVEPEVESKQKKNKKTNKAK